jgi:hypothetical protein
VLDDEGILLLQLLLQLFFGADKNYRASCASDVSMW